MAQRPTILVVEDEVLVRLDLVSTLEDAGYQTLEASSAAEAISILQRRPEISVVFTDIQMPGDMDGLALAHFVRERWPPTIIVVSSGRVQPAPGEMPENVWFLAKPYERRTLGSILSEVAAKLGDTP